MKRVLLTGIIAIIGISLHAQTNFSGSWNLTEKQYINGPEYANALSDKMTISQNKDSLIIEVVTIDQDGKETKSRSSVAMNGKISSTTSAATGRKLDKSIQWSADKKVLTMTTVIHKADAPDETELTRVDTYTLSSANQLTVNRKSIETASENWEATGTYAKQ